MSRTISKRDIEVKDNLSGWDKAIADAKKGILRLRIAIEDCEAKKAVGEPWPGTREENVATRN
jgi:hypothetical protein